MADPAARPAGAGTDLRSPNLLLHSLKTVRSKPLSGPEWTHDVGGHSAGVRLA